ncbi:M23 family metallopeptidase [Hoeflea sp. YIM 152468]|uniref:M23 family metallopeptidase n=1 Tax=Hoeflea sp. YIM 152468 TaxID=3031759 RepID=UPI0023D9D105|nr:M23 family metallopeptidase [Hoeflea sp. YIM 152468]MDF1609643.1 M23 family metallopeptidase [Hoeflea sp. YIM 152468]
MYRAFFTAGIFLLAFIGTSYGQVNMIEQGRARTEAFFAGQLESVWRDMTPELQGQLGSKTALSDFRQQLKTDLGKERRVRDETVQPGNDGMISYIRTADWSEVSGAVRMTWTFDPSGQIAGFRVRPAAVAADSRFLDYATKAEMQLPFTGRWYVYWGGRTLEQNYHAVNPAQRFAYDFLIMRDGSSFAGDDPTRIESYYCWGEPILAPADATVVAAVSDRDDNLIGRTDAAKPLGNHVVLDVGNSEFIFLAHMQKDSLEVAPGDSVTAGDRLGRCGNSGNSSEPHVHLHMQTTAKLGQGEGLPVQFQNFEADGSFFERGEPVKGQQVSPQ